MNKFLKLFLIATFALLLQSCVSSRSSTTIARDVNLLNYNHIIFGDDDGKGSVQLNDLMLMVENILTQRFKTVTPSEAQNLILQGQSILSPKIDITTEKWDGGHTFITITFYDYSTNQRIAVVKSSGIGFSISQDQKLALKGIKKEFSTHPLKHNTVN